MSSAEPHQHSSRRRDRILAAILLLAVFVVYHPALHGDLLLDDDVHVTRPELQSLAGLARIWTDLGATQQYYPVLHTAFWLEHQVWGEDVLGYHLVNVLLHSLAALLVVAMTRRLEVRGGWVAAFVFALHPIAVESVAWISEQKNTLSAVFYLGAARVFLCYTERRDRRSFAVASVLFACALLSKTATATLPAALLVILWWRKGRLEMKRDVLPLVPWFAAAIVAGMVTVSVERALISGINANLSLTAIDRIVIAGRSLWVYLGHVLWPASLSFLYERWETGSASASQFGFPAFALVVAVVLVWLARRRRGPLAAFLYFAGTLAPVLGVVNVEWFVFAFVADHFVYVASLGVVVPLVAVATTQIQQLSGFAQRCAAAATVTLLGVLGALSWRYSGTFRDSITLYSHAVARAPDSIAANYLLGVALAEKPGREDDAIRSFEQALRLNPESPDVHEKLGAVFLQMPGRTRDAVTHLENALRLRPDSKTVPRKLAAAWFDQGKQLAASPRDANDARIAYERAVQLDPGFVEAHFNLGNLLLRSPGGVRAAITHFEIAVRLKPDFAEAHTNLGSALVTQPGRLADAIAHFEAALRANPDFAPARNNLARARQLRE
jgi:protein O-mannosyl-transferase